MNEPERTAQSSEPQDIDGGNDYDYGARDFGDQPINVALRSETTDTHKQLAATPAAPTAEKEK